jgi:uncharacterized membrane protein YqgA involved in biofilm formation
MFVGAGTVLNIVAIIIGGAIGVALGSKFKQGLRDLITQVLGCVTFITAADAMAAYWNSELVDQLPNGATMLVVVFSLLFGAILGSFMRIEERLENAGSTLKQRFSKKGNSHFVEGFVSASLIFAIGPLAIMGSISDGMGTGLDQLVLKSTMDFFTAMAFAATLGWGVAASSLPVGIYQFLWTGIGLFLGAILATYQILAMTAVGGVLLLGIALRMLKIKQIAVGNLLPAIAIAPVLALLAKSIA